MFGTFTRFILFSIIIATNFTAFSSTPPEDIFKDEETFLRYAGPEWGRIWEGVYERKAENGVVQRIGFGIESFEYYLDSAYEEREAIKAKLTEGKGGDELEKQIEKNEALIAYLEKGLARGYHAQKSQSGYVCASGYTLDPSFGVNFAGGWAKATATWSEFGPYAPYIKHFFVSATAINTGTKPETVDYRYDSADISGTCCFSINSGQAEASPTFTCDLESRALLYVYNGCNAYRTAQVTGSCQ